MTSPHPKENINSYYINQIKGYAIFTTDKNGFITSWNEGAERLKGYSEEEIIGKYYGILHTDENQKEKKPQKEMEEAINQGTYEGEGWRKRKDGSLFWATVTLTPIYSDEGQLEGFTKVTGDITKQKELQDELAKKQENALEQKNDQLQKINLDLDNFIYTASHDLRSPITNIEALMSLLKEELSNSNSLNPDLEEILQRVISSVKRFKHTIEDLTEISRLEKDFSESPSDEVLLVTEVYEDIIADLNFPEDLKICSIETDFQVNQLKFSKKNFRSILYNLISNAVKYQAPERDCVVYIQTRLETPYVVLSVKDNGLGMSERQQEQLYTMFKRFHDHVEGTGIGLYMVNRIVENAGGKIEVDSQVGIGTEFKIYLEANK